MSNDNQIYSGASSWAPPGTAASGEPATLENTPIGGANANGTNSNGGGGGGYGGGGGGGGLTVTPEQQKAGDNLGGITGWNMGSILGSAANADKVFDISDQQNKNLQDIQARQVRRNAGNDWFTQQQRLQSAVTQLRQAQGNALRGTNLYDMLDLIERKDDMDDVEVLNNLRENLNSVDNDYWKALMANNNSRNEMYASTERDLRDLAGDYVAQMNSINPKLADSMVDVSGHTINPPGWLQTSYFDSHVRPAVKPTERGLVRPDKASEGVWGAGQDKDNAMPDTNRTGAQEYWRQLYRGYERRI